MNNDHELPAISLSNLATVTGGVDGNTGITGGIPNINNQVPASAQGGVLARARNAATGFAGGLACLGKFTVDGTPGTNSYDTYLACQRKAHQF